MMFPEHVLMVRASVEAAHEAEFNRWYNSEHLPDVLKLPGCTAAARYRVVQGDGSHDYLAAYAFDSQPALDAVLGSEHMQRMIREFDENVGAFSTRSRATYTQIYALER